MASAISDAHFTAAEGVADWRALFWGAKALFLTGDFAGGVRFAQRIAEVAADLGHAPIVQIVGDSVIVQVITVGVGLSDLDLELARGISAAAAELGVPADPAGVQQVQLAFDAADPEPVMAFWQAALGYLRVGPSDFIDPNLVPPTMWFQQKDYVSPRNRIHVDVSVPHDVAEARVEAVLAAGGRLLSDRHAPSAWSLIDPEGNVVDIATWQERA